MHFSHRHALHPQLGDGMPHLVQLEGPDDRSDDLHDVHVATLWAWFVSIDFIYGTREPTGSAPEGVVQNPCHGPARVSALNARDLSQPRTLSGMRTKLVH